MPVRICTALKSDGQPCRAVATRGARLCRQHARQAARDHRRHRARNQGRTVRLGPLTTRAAIHRALQRILSPLAAGTLPLDRAGHYFHRIQLALQAVKRAESNSRQPVVAEEACGLQFGPFPTFCLSPEMQEIWEDAWRAATAAGATGA
ncbi:MAG TPA: hypothetical protein VII58_09445 [Acidobacteriaceae bacterium]